LVGLCAVVEVMVTGAPYRSASQFAAVRAAARWRQKAKCIQRRRLSRRACVSLIVVTDEQIVLLQV